MSTSNANDFLNFFVASFFSTKFSVKKLSPFIGWFLITIIVKHKRHIQSFTHYYPIITVRPGTKMSDFKAGYSMHDKNKYTNKQLHAYSHGSYGINNHKREQKIYSLSSGIKLHTREGHTITLSTLFPPSSIQYLRHMFYFFTPFSI